MLGAGSYASFYSERVSAALTPGVRVRLARGAGFRRGLSFGAGVALLQRTGTDYQVGPAERIAERLESTAALAPAGGADIRLSRWWFFREELRNYLYRTPVSGFVASFPYWGTWHYNPVAVLSLGIRFST